MVGHGGSSASLYLAHPTSPIPSHCASIVATSTVRVKRQMDLTGYCFKYTDIIVCLWSNVILSEAIIYSSSMLYSVLLFLCAILNNIRPTLTHYNGFHHGTLTCAHPQVSYAMENGTTSVWETTFKWQANKMKTITKYIQFFFCPSLYLWIDENTPTPHP